MRRHDAGRRRTSRMWAGVLTGLALAGSAAAAAGDSDWPQFHGPRRDNRSAETGLLRQWPADGPKRLWTAKGLGEGFATVSIAEGLIYTTGNIGRHTVITALDLAGRPRWTFKNGPAYRRSHPGTRGTPTIDGGRLYHENADGDVVCLDARTAKPVWSLNILKKFHGRNISWGLAESLLIDGNHVICTPGGKGAGLVALDKRSGRTVWVCRELDDKPGYCSPVVFEHGGIRQIATLMARSVVAVHADTGKLLWQVEHVTPFDENITSPIYHDGCVFLSSRTTGSRLLRLNVRDGKMSAEEVWRTRAMDNQHGGVLLLDGHLYGACHSSRRGSWLCLEFKTGRATYAGRGLGRASATFADGMLYLMDHQRIVALLRPTPKAFEPVSRFRLPQGGRGPSWAHPVVCAGRLYLRHGEFLYCYDVKQRAGDDAPAQP
jgi:outer membrane protein assembly factor BamB